MDQWRENVQNWLSHPFQPKGGVGSWALFVLLMLVLIGLWTRLLSHLGEGF